MVLFSPQAQGLMWVVMPVVGFRQFFLSVYLMGCVFCLDGDVSGPPDGSGEGAAGIR